MRTEHHWPASLPRLRDMGHPVEPTSGDVNAIYIASVRLMRGEVIESITVRCEPVRVEMIDGVTFVTVGEQRRGFQSAFDALLVAYDKIGNFNISWADFEGGNHV